MKGLQEGENFMWHAPWIGAVCIVFLLDGGAVYPIVDIRDITHAGVGTTQCVLYVLHTPASKEITSNANINKET